MDDVVTSGLPAFPMRRTCPLDPPHGYTALRAGQAISRVVLPTGKTAWLIMSHEYLRQILGDPRVSVNRTSPGYPHLIGVDPQSMGPIASITNALVGLDPPEHAIHRRMIINEFTVRRLQAMRPRLQEITDGRINDLLGIGPPADLAEALSIPVPSLMICELLGVPYGDHAAFQRYAHVAFGAKATPHDRFAAILELRAYLDKLVADKEGHPGDDLIGRLVVRYRDADIYDHEHMVGLATLLLIAGHETTANMITLGTLALMENPGQLAEIKRDPAVIPRAVDEILRYLSIADAIGGARVALDDIEIGGVVIRKGDGLIALLSGANRDETVYGDPDTLDIRRGARQHVAFGYGIHQCLGQNLARMELEIVFGTLFKRIPELRLAIPIEKLLFKDEMSGVYGLHEMPVTW